MRKKNSNSSVPSGMHSLAQRSQQERRQKMEQQRVRTVPQEPMRVPPQQPAHFGRQPMQRPENFLSLQQRWERGEISARQAAEQLKITHRTFLLWVKEKSDT